MPLNISTYSKTTFNIYHSTFLLRVTEHKRLGSAVLYILYEILTAVQLSVSTSHTYINSVYCSN